MNLNLDGHVVIVSGGAGRDGSIGRAITETLCAEGAIVVVLDVAGRRGESLQENLSQRGYNARFFEADVRRSDVCAEVVDQCVNELGRIDAVVNNVGVNDGVSLEATAEEFVESLTLNLLPHFLLVKHSLSALREARGSIVSIASKVAVTGQGGTSGYAAAKGGVLALIREWAVDLAADGVRANAIVPAECWTPSYQSWLSTLPDGEALRSRISNRVPLGRRMTRPQEIADLAAFLVSGRSSHITGQHLSVDGGYVHLDRAYDDLNEK